MTYLPPMDLKDLPPSTHHEQWVEIGKRCSAGRRSMWMRLIMAPSDDDVHFYTPETVAAIELRAGREGNDDYVRIGNDNPQFRELLDVLLSARFAATT